jgi:hypothetical protein
MAQETETGNPNRVYAWFVGGLENDHNKFCAFMGYFLFPTIFFVRKWQDWIDKQNRLMGREEESSLWWEMLFVLSALFWTGVFVIVAYPMGWL